MSRNYSFLVRRVFPTAHGLFLRSILNKYWSRIGGSVLVIGAGHADYSAVLPHATSITLTDIDSSLKDLDVVCDCTSLPFANDSFDSVVMIEVLEHVFDFSAAIAEAFRVLKPGGTILLSTPFLFPKHGDPFDFHRFTDTSLSRHLEQFSSMSVQGFGSPLGVCSDILTRSHKILLPMRVLNHLICLPRLFRVVSHSNTFVCSGYALLGRK